MRKTRNDLSEKLINDNDRLSILNGMILATTEGTARRCQIDGIPLQVKPEQGNGEIIT